MNRLTVAERRVEDALDEVKKSKRYQENRPSRRNLQMNSDEYEELKARIDQNEAGIKSNDDELSANLSF